MILRYSLLCVLGALLPLSQFVPWLVAHGLDVRLFAQLAFGEPVAAFAWLDVLISGVALLLFIVVESRRIGVPRAWLAVLALLSVGVSLALPLFLLQRERCLMELRRGS